LQKDPRRRYASAGALAEDLRRLLAGEPIRARPVGRAERLWRWCRRNPQVASLVGAVALTLVLGIAFTSFFAYRAHEEAGLARKREREAWEAQRLGDRRGYGLLLNLAQQAWE